MTFISHAQNYEDVMLWRALKHIESGFYIDAGAWSPNLDSVTKAFYERGWQGINVEPNPDYIEQYAEKRSKDINLCVAVSDHVGEDEMYFVSNPGLSSLNRNIAEGHRSLGWETAPANVKIRTLVDICEEYCLTREIHFLKVDVEGFEEQALKGNDWVRFRPWVVVVEATLPMSQIENHEAWEPILLNAHYALAYVDGLNRFYVAVEHEELLTAFKYPPNVFDDFKMASETRAEVKAEQAEAKAEQAEVKAERAEVKAEQAEAKVERAEARAEQAEAKALKFHSELLLLYASRSWRITKPIRKSMQFFTKIFCLLGRLMRRSLRLPKRAGHWCLVTLRAYLLKRPELKARVRIWLHSYPKLEAKLRQLAAIENHPHVYEIEAPLPLNALDKIRPVTDGDIDGYLRRIYDEIEQRKTEPKIAD